MNFTLLAVEICHHGLAPESAFAFNPDCQLASKPPPVPPCQGSARSAPPLTRGGWEGLGWNFWLMDNLGLTLPLRT